MSWIGCMALEGMLWARTGVVGLEKLLWGWRGGVGQGTVGCNGAGWGGCGTECYTMEQPWGQALLHTSRTSLPSWLNPTPSCTLTWLPLTAPLMW